MLNGLISQSGRVLRIFLADDLLRAARATLEDHLQLLRCDYNFVRPHRALKCGHAVRTPAMQAVLFRQRLTFRKIFSPAIIFCVRGKFMLVFAPSTISVVASNKGMSLEA